LKTAAGQYIRASRWRVPVQVDLFEILKLVAVPGAGGVLWLVWHLNRETRAQTTEAVKAQAEEVRRELTATVKRVEEAHEELQAQRVQQSALQLELAKHYATKQDVERLENRVVGLLERLSAKVDKIAENLP